MLEKLKKEVFKANLELVKQNLVIYTWGNVSARDGKTGYIIIKPSGVPYSEMGYKDMVIVDSDGNRIEGNYNPSSDTLTHLEIYKAFPDIKSIVHTHSEWATPWAQAKTDIPSYGTTHADYFYGNVFCTRELTNSEIKDNYEKNTGKVIIERIKESENNALELPGILVANHGPFSWGKNPQSAVHNAKVLEEIAKMAYRTEVINKRISTINDNLLDKHYLRKHGKNSYYGQD